jgi:hypothetical protein
MYKASMEDSLRSVREKAGGLIRRFEGEGQFRVSNRPHPSVSHKNRSLARYEQHKQQLHATFCIFYVFLKVLWSPGKGNVAAKGVKFNVQQEQGLRNFFTSWCFMVTRSIVCGVRRMKIFEKLSSDGVLQDEVVQVLLNDHVLHALHRRFQECCVGCVREVNVDFSIGDSVDTAEPISKVLGCRIVVRISAVVVGEMRRDGRYAKFVSEKIDLVEEEDDGLPFEPFTIDE